MTDNIIPFINGEEEKSEVEPLKIFGRIANGEFLEDDSIPPDTSAEVLALALRAAARSRGLRS